MKKFILAALLLIPFYVGHADDSDPYRWSANSWTWSPSVTSSSDIAFQIYNPVTATGGGRTIYITQITPSSTAAGTFTAYSTGTGAGFTGTKTLSGAISVLAQSSATVANGTANVSVSSVTTCSASSAYTGNVMWQGVNTASTTFNVFPESRYPLVLPPGTSLYLVKTNATGLEKTSVSFYWTENTR